MRKFFFICIAFVFVMIGFSIYVIYDTKQFIDNLPQPPPQALPQADESPQKPALRNEVGLDPPLPAEVVEDRLVSPSEASYSSDGFAEDNVRTHGEAFSIVEELAEQDKNQISSELEELFIQYYVLDEKRRSIVKILEPMHEEHVAIIDRHHEISHALGSGPDPETQQALNKEREVLLAKEQELQPRIFEVQDEKERVVEKLESLVQEYGFLSWEEFRGMHKEDYKAWRTSQ